MAMNAIKSNLTELFGMLARLKKNLKCLMWELYVIMRLLHNIIDGVKPYTEEEEKELRELMALVDRLVEQETGGAAAGKPVEKAS